NSAAPPSVSCAWSSSSDAVGVRKPGAFEVSGYAFLARRPSIGKVIALAKAATILPESREGLRGVDLEGEKAGFDPGVLPHYPVDIFGIRVRHGDARGSAAIGDGADDARQASEVQGVIALAVLPDQVRQPAFADRPGLLKARAGLEYAHGVRASFLECVPQHLVGHGRESGLTGVLCRSTCSALHGRCGVLRLARLGCRSGRRWHQAELLPEREPVRDPP